MRTDRMTPQQLRASLSLAGIFGLAIFAVGSVVAALAHTLPMIILGRVIHGGGAISAAVAGIRRHRPIAGPDQDSAGCARRNPGTRCE